MTGTRALPAAASIAVRQVLCGPARRATVLATFPTACYLAVDGQDSLAYEGKLRLRSRLPNRAHRDGPLSSACEGKLSAAVPGGAVVAVIAAGGLALPNALLLGATRAERPFARVSAGDPATVGDGQVRLATLVVAPGRWWDPRPALPACSAETLANGLAELPPPLSAAPAEALVALAQAVDAHDPQACRHAVIALLGAGPGLTPAGDDVIAGVLATLCLLGSADEGLHAALAGTVLRLAGQRTTALSAALLTHAVRGEVIAPAGRLLRALAGRGSVAGSASALGRVGHTSGHELMVGIALAARAVAASRVKQPAPAMQESRG